MCLVQTEWDCIKLKVHFRGLKMIGGKKIFFKKKHIHYNYDIL